MDNRGVDLGFLHGVRAGGLASWGVARLPAAPVQRGLGWGGQKPSNLGPLVWSCVRMHPISCGPAVQRWVGAAVLPLQSWSQPGQHGLCTAVMR